MNLHRIVDNRGRCRRFGQGDGAFLGIGKVRAVDATLLDMLLVYCWCAHNALAVKLEPGVCCATCEQPCTIYVVILTDLGDGALLVADTRTSNDVGHINAAICSVAVCDTLIKCVGE